MKGYPFLGRLLCLLFGLLFLLIVAPQQNPWTLNNISSQFSGSETIIQIQVTLLHKKIEFSLYTLTWGTYLLLTGLIISSAQARWALMAFVRNESVDISGRDGSLFDPLVDKDLPGISGINRRTVNSQASA